jgi:hypothetical protein
MSRNDSQLLQKTKKIADFGKKLQVLRKNCNRGAESAVPKNRDAAYFRLGHYPKIAAWPILTSERRRARILGTAERTGLRAYNNALKL